LIRFNGVGDFNPQFPNRAVGEVFECADLVFACGGNRVLFRRQARQSFRPDYFLLVVSSARFGEVNFEASDWGSESLTRIAVSHIGERQEAMLLMKAGDWVRSTLGMWQLRVAPNLRHGASLQLLEDGVLD
jgi:iron-sulfur cluster repair protein YtfE (RIC family)